MDISARRKSESVSTDMVGVCLQHQKDILSSKCSYFISEMRSKVTSWY